MIPENLGGLLRIWIPGLMIVLVFQQGVKCQNLVPNPSFEFKTSCPNNLGQVPLATSWSPSGPGTPDYYNSCATNGSGVSVPSNTFGNQTARTGQAYAGFIARHISAVREYLQVPLTSPLMPGSSYQVSFYISLSDASQWSIDKLGAYLSVGPAPASSGYVINGVAPQVKNPIGNYLANKSGWTLISGTYIALGGEDHLTIGNFADDVSTTPSTGLGGFYPGSYYYIDDIVVEEIAHTKGNCDLAIGKSPTKGSVPLIVGHSATFQITVTNIGTGPCKSPISIADSFSTGMTYLSGGSSGWSCPTNSIVGPNSVSCTNALPLASNQSSSLLITVQITAASIVGNCVSVKNGNDSNLGNNRACLKLQSH